MKVLSFIFMASLLPISALSQTCQDHFPNLKAGKFIELPARSYFSGSEATGIRAWARQLHLIIDGHELRHSTLEFGISNREMKALAEVRDSRREIVVKIFNQASGQITNRRIEVPADQPGYIGNLSLQYSGAVFRLNYDLVTPGVLKKTLLSLQFSESGEINQLPTPKIEVPLPTATKPAVVEAPKPKAPEPPKREVKKVDLPADWYESTLVEFREKFGKGDVEFVKTFLETHWDKIFVTEDNAYTKYLSWALRAAGDSYNPPIAVRLVLVQMLPSQHPLITYRNPEDSYSIVERNYQFAWDSRDKDYNELLRQLINKGGVVVNHNSTSDLTRNIKNNHDFGRSLDSDVRNLILFHANKIGLRPPKRPY